MTTRIIRARGLVRGRARGPALVAREPVSFLGDIDIGSGTIVGQLPSVRGRCVRGAVLVMPDSIGSAGAWRFLYQLHVHGNHPAAIVSLALPDPSLVQGAILAGVPMLCSPGENVLDLADGTMLVVDGTEGTIAIP